MIIFIIFLNIIYNVTIRKFRFKINIFSFSIILVIFSLFFPILSNFDINSIRYTSQLALFFAGMLLTYITIQKENDFLIWINAVMIGLFLNALFGLYESIIWILNNGFVIYSKNEWFRVDGICVSPADYVMLLIIGAILTPLIKKNYIKIGAQSLYIVLLIISMSRSALVVGTFIILLFLSDFKYKKTGIILIIILIIFIFSYYEPENLLISRVTDIANTDFNIRRIYAFQDIINKIFQDARTLIIGSREGSYLYYHPIDLEYYDNPHNIFLFIWYQQGIIGFIAFLYVLKFLISTTFLRYKESFFLKNHVLNKLFLSLLVLHLSTWIIGLVESNILGVNAGWLLGSIFGIVLCPYISIIKRNYRITF